MNPLAYEIPVGETIPPTVAASGRRLSLGVHRRAGDESIPGWLADVQQMRGAVLYEDGRRPSFRRVDGRFYDGDAIDLEAYHVVARSGDQAVGCVRILPLHNADATMIETRIAAREFENILRDLGTTRAQTCEASRWMALPEFRGELGPWMVAASWTVAQSLGMAVALVLAGTRQKQDLALVRMGARAVKGVPLFVSEVFDDELRLLYFDLPNPPAAMRRRMADEPLPLPEESRAASGFRLASLPAVIV